MNDVTRVTGVTELIAFLKAIKEKPELPARNRHQAMGLIKALEDNGRLGRNETLIMDEVMSAYLRVVRKM